MVYKTFLTHTGVYYGGMRDGAAYGLLTEVNELAAQGVHAGSAEIRIEIPADMDKSRMHSIRNHIAKAMEKLETEDFQLEELHIAGEKCAALRVPQIVITAAGEIDHKERIADALLTARAGQDIVYAGWAGLEGMLRIIGEKEAELRERFTPAFIGQMKAYDSELCGLSKIAVADAMGVSVIRQVSRGGILASLWDLANDTELGLNLDLKKIAVRQETIEVCEHFRLNPYQLASGGSFLMLTENGEALADALNQKGIQAAVIGQLTDSNDKIIHNGEDMRYIDRPAPDELMKVF
ncbi:AIR synthase-related protein [Dorea ammoniilytica]|uniref:AIR synthase-related protein n=1 Tax=Dorea ammoniilytica TaxID=2981788 RepID=A0ABT2S706_9FIRM|nr:AIR synthase-related protein [Dorea ammoniilytica]MCU6700371.1 AIR synthase-related protein [Dorea ammoniilytica]SCH83195.1 Hydrogenase maturation factor [uncultured Eubacterium sp.]